MYAAILLELSCIGNYMSLVLMCQALHELPGLVDPVHLPELVRCLQQTQTQIRPHYTHYNVTVYHFSHIYPLQDKVPHLQYKYCSRTPNRLYLYIVQRMTIVHENKVRSSFVDT